MSAVGGNSRSIPCAWIRLCCKQCVLKSPGPLPSFTCEISATAMCCVWKAHKVSPSYTNSHWKKVATPITACSVEQIRPFKTRRGRFHHSLTLPAFYCKYYPKTVCWTYFPGMIRQLRAYIYSWNQQSFHFYCSPL